MTSPLRAYLRVEALTNAELRQVLTDAAEEAERLIPKLIEQGGVGQRIRAAQLSLVLREIRALMAATFGDVGRVVQEGRLNAADAAARGEDVLLAYLRERGLGAEADTLLESFVAQAKQGFATIRAKASNGIPLSSQVYRTQALATGWVNRVVSRGLLLGHAAKDIAKDVRGLIDPNVKGGVSYAAMRLARTELNNAFRTAQEARYKDEPWTRGMRWNLSGSHPAPDVCNVNAEQDAHGLGSGVYQIGERPDSHPNCLCYLTPEQADEDAFIDGFLAGEYDEYLEGVDGGAAVVASRSPAPTQAALSMFEARARQSAQRREALDLATAGLPRRGSLDAKQRKALRMYESHFFPILNGFLRGGARVEDPTDRTTLRAVEAIDSAMRPLGKDAVVWRGIARAERLFGDRLGGNVEGFTWQELAYSSTSTLPEVADQFTVPSGSSASQFRVKMRVLVPDSQKAVVVSLDHDGGQAELLLARGTTWRVVHDHGVHPDGYRLLDVEVVRA